ncbi:hypothetical protein [Ornithinibacillus halophilus]|uniref:Uncharacterized protein n=1 Tax=Ornithinibacillus halophilus TaxID=930117 RepID=A0A1M5DUF3_9BACI|nr:hypothetical protein [Ornithinibacillus halophilus]SHF70569.1 hypothetical protein SAMN05216225_10039 [Ornithinibacillus halophilus]
MRNEFLKIFWGFLFVLIEIHIAVIDLLPDPIGYYLIYSGISSLTQEHQIGKKATNWASALCVISIPSVFVQQAVDTMRVLSEWSIYFLILGLLKLILVFYVFQVLLELAKRHEARDLASYTKKLFKAYVVIMLVIQIIQPFIINIPPEIMHSLLFIIPVTILIMEVIFIVLIFKYRNLREKPEVPLITEYEES